MSDAGTEAPRRTTTGKGPPMDHDILDQRTSEERDRDFLPGMGRPWLLPLYDVFSRLSGVRPVHERAAALADVAPGESVLDVGCGTANLSLAVLRAQPAARVTGLDPDGAALRVASRKAGRRRLALTLVQGFADRLPGADGSFDHVVSALALHHVPDGAREQFGREALRVLRPGGRVTIADFGSTGGDHGHGDHGHGHGQRRGRSAVAANPHTARNLEGGLLRLLADAGFTDAREVAYLDHRYGPLTFVQATRS